MKKEKKKFQFRNWNFLSKSSIEEHPLTESRRTACRRVDPGTDPTSNKDPSSRSLPYPFFSRPIYSISLPLSVGRGRIQKREAASIKKKNEYTFTIRIRIRIIIISIDDSVCTCRSFFFFFFFFFMCVIARVSIQRFILEYEYNSRE